MPRLVPRLAVALLVLAGSVVAANTVLDSLEQEVQERVQAAPEIEPQFGQDATAGGLPVMEFLLLDETELAPGAATPNGRTLTLDEWAQLTLPEGTRIQFGSMPVPRDSTLQLQGSARYDGRTIDVVGGGVLRVGDSNVLLPPGSRVTFPSDADVGLDPGAVAPSSAVAVPAGSVAELPPVTMDSQRVLTLPAGARLVLDEGTWEGPLSTLPVSVPAGTTVLGPPGQHPVAATDDFAGDGSAQTLFGRAAADAIEGRRTEITITQYPAEGVEKGVPFEVRGLVRTVDDGAGSPDHPVVLYANATKDQPGFVLGRATTDADGVWAVVATLDETRAARPYHLVAQAVGRPDASPPLTESWSDPIIGVRGATHLALHAPDVEGRGVPVALQIVLTDVFGAPVPDAAVELRLEGHPAVTLTTNDGGEATHTLERGYGRSGEYLVQAAFQGTTHLGASANATRIRIVDAAIATAPTAEVLRGEPLRIGGVLVAGDEPVDGVRIEARLGSPDVAGDVTEWTFTDAGGGFAMELPVPALLPVGNTTVVLSDDQFGTQRTVLVHVLGRARLDLASRDLVPLDGAIPVDVTVTDELGTALQAARVEIEWSGEHLVAWTDGSGVARASIPARASGDVPIAAAVKAAHHVPDADETLSRVGPLLVDGEPRVVIGEPVSIDLSMRVGERAFAPRSAFLTLPGQTVPGRATADGTTMFTGSTPVQGTAPGLHEVGLSLPAFDLAQGIAVAFVERPSLAIQTPEAIEPGEPLRVTVTAATPRGPLTGIPIALRGAGGADAFHSAPTDPSGTASFEIDVPEGASGVVELTATIADTDTTAHAQASRAVQIASAGFPWAALLAPLAVIAVAWAALAAVRRRRTEALAPAVVDARRPSKIEIRLAPQRSGLPAVWHPGEPVAVQVRTRHPDGSPIPHADVRVDGPGGEIELTTDATGAATTSVTFPATGTHRLDGRFAGARASAPAEGTLDVRIVDYREEIEREYSALARRLQARGDLGGRDHVTATPRDVERALGATRQAAACVRLFEIADFSRHPVHRSEYEQFMKAKAGAERRAA